jgi:hypothetical protein
MPVPLPSDKVESPPGAPSAQLWQVAAFMAAVVGYFIFFVATEPKRYLVLNLLLLPDQIVQSWCDGECFRF